MKNSRQSHIKRNLWLRAQIIQAVRTFFIDNDYLEVETPCRIPAPAPEAHIDARAFFRFAGASVKKRGAQSTCLK
jgi:elongation factor P--beta-lysine ligase